MQTSAPSTDTRLLVLLAKPEFAPTDAAEASELSASCDWKRVVAMARFHGVDAQLHRRVTSIGDRSIPDPVMNDLTEQASIRGLRNLQLTADLFHVIGLLTKEGIEVMPFKGPALADRIYGDVALRSFGDLDILVHRNDFDAVKRLLMEDGFEDLPSLTGKAEADFLETQMGYEFAKRESRTVVEVHWALLNRVHAFDLAIDDVWQRSTTRRFAGTTVPAMSGEDLLIYLCAHGAKSFWTRLGWICDVAALIQTDDEVDWDLVQETTRSVHGETILFLGLRLARDLLDVGLPPEVARLLDDDRASARLARKVVGWIWGIPVPTISNRDRIRFHLQMRERIRDRVPYYGHVLRNIVGRK